MKYTAFIFARGGSKGLPDKNILPFGGKPLIAWSIELAQSVDRINRVIVSTDSQEIAAIGRQYGADVPFMRPENLATDESPEWLSWRHGLEYLKKSEGSMPQFLLSIPTTSPLRSIDDINNCLDEYEKGFVDVIITIKDSHRNPYFNMVKKNGDGTFGLVNTPKSAIVRRQECPTVYDMTTVCYIVNSEFVMHHDSIFEGRVRAVHIPAERAVDIDSLVDFQIASALLEIRDGK